MILQYIKYLYGIEFFCFYNYNNSFMYDVYFENINSGKELFLEVIFYFVIFCWCLYNVILVMGSFYYEEIQKKK